MSDELNPYEPSRVESSPPSFREATPGVEELERRVAALEKRVSGSWLLSSNFLRRVVAVWIYVIVGYAILTLIFIPIILVFDLLLWR